MTHPAVLPHFPIPGDIIRPELQGANHPDEVAWQKAFELYMSDDFKPEIPYEYDIFGGWKVDTCVHKLTTWIALKNEFAAIKSRYTSAYHMYAT